MASADTQVPSVTSFLSRKPTAMAKTPSSARFNEIDVLEHVSSPTSNGTRSLPAPQVSSTSLQRRKSEPAVLKDSATTEDIFIDASDHSSNSDNDDGAVDHSDDDLLFDEKEDLDLGDNWDKPLPTSPIIKTAGKKPMKLLETAERWRAQVFGFQISLPL